MSQKHPNYLLPIIVMFFLFAMISFVTGFQNPFGTILKEQLALSNWQSQLGNAANFIAYAFMGLPAGIILQRKGYKFTAISAVLVGLAGVCLMLASSALTAPGEIFAVYLTGAFVAGFSMCMLNTVVNPMLNTLGGGGNRSNQLLQFGGSCNSLAATICPVLVGYLIGNDMQGATLQSAQPALMIAGGIFVFALLVLAISKLPEPGLERARQLATEGKTEEQPSISKALKYRHYVLGVIAIFVYVGVEVGIPTYANYFMVNELHVAPAVAGSLVGAYWLLMLVGRLLGGVVAAKVSSKAMLTAVSVVALCLLICSMVLDPAQKMQIVGVTSTLEFDMVDMPVNVLCMVLCGLCTSVMWGGIFNLAVAGLDQRLTSVAAGFFMVMVCGGGILPLIQGAVADAQGYLVSFIVPLLGVLYLLFYALVGSKTAAGAGAETPEAADEAK